LVVQHHLEHYEGVLDLKLEEDSKQAKGVIPENQDLALA
jgi:hypothetical protein